MQIGNIIGKHKQTASNNVRISNIDYKTSLKISTLEFIEYIEVISFTSNSVQPHAIQPYHGDR